MCGHYPCNGSGGVGGTSRLCVCVCVGACCDAPAWGLHAGTLGMHVHVARHKGGDKHPSNCHPGRDYNCRTRACRCRYPTTAAAVPARTFGHLPLPQGRSQRSPGYAHEGCTNNGPLSCTGCLRCCRWLSCYRVLPCVGAVGAVAVGFTTHTFGSTWGVPYVCVAKQSKTRSEACRR